MKPENSRSITVMINCLNRTRPKKFPRAVMASLAAKDCYKLLISNRNRKKLIGAHVQKSHRG